MLYPLSYEGITGFSSPNLESCCFQHNLSTTFGEMLLTTLDHSPLFKHVSVRSEYLTHWSEPTTQEMESAIDAERKSFIVFLLKLLCE